MKELFFVFWRNASFENTLAGNNLIIFQASLLNADIGENEEILIVLPWAKEVITYRHNSYLTGTTNS